MAALTKQRIALPFITPQFTAANAGGDTCEPGDQTFLVVKNGGGSNMNVTLQTNPATTEWGAVVPNHITAVPAGTERWFGPLRGGTYADPTTGQVIISYSAVTSVTVGVFRT